MIKKKRKFKSSIKKNSLIFNFPTNNTDFKNLNVLRKNNLNLK